MPTAPLRFQVLLNGQPVATTGVGGPYGVLTAIVSWVRRSPDMISAKVRAQPGFDEQRFLQESCALELSALDSATNGHDSWGRRSIGPGDEVTIRVLPGGDFDAPDNAR